MNSMAATYTPARRTALVFVLVAIVLAACGTSDADTPGAAGAASDGTFEGVAIELPRPKPEFVLTDTSGDPYDFAAETADRVTLLYFGYTFCPDICPVHLSQIEAALDRPGAPRNVDVVFVTVDPERDSPARLRSWLDNFGTGVVGLTGTEEELVAAQEAAGLVPASRYDDDGEGNYLMAHAGQVIAYAPDGLAYVEYPFGTRQSHWVHDLPILATLGGDPT